LQDTPNVFASLNAKIVYRVEFWVSFHISGWYVVGVRSVTLKRWHVGKWLYAISGSLPSYLASIRSLFGCY
jgi:hypothetical protein